jgi:hypothetical protein
LQWTVPATNALTGTVWDDKNGDGSQDNGEPAVPWVSVGLYTGAGVEVGETITDGNGNYHFASVPSGTYYLVVNATPGFGYGASDSGGHGPTFQVTSGTPLAQNLPLVPVAALSAEDDSYSDSDYHVNMNTGVLTIQGPGVLANDLGVTSAVTASLISTTTHGSLTLNSNGSFSYLPNGPRANYPGSDSFVYQVTDGTVTWTATVHLSVDEPYHTAAKGAPLPPAAGGVVFQGGPSRLEFRAGRPMFFITDDSVRFDSFCIWWQGGLDRTTGVRSWDDVAAVLANFPTTDIYISGHGSTEGGVAASGSPLSYVRLLNNPTAADIIRRSLTADGRIIILACGQGVRTEMRRLARLLGRQVIANTGQVYDGNYGTGDWAVFNP